jgi:deoxyribodipyrimidine photolyase-related protein
MKIFLVYPHQLFANTDCLRNKKVLLIEEPLFFTLYPFHIQKLVLHRASMKYYFEYLLSQNIDVEYFEDESYLDIFKNNDMTLYDVVDYWLFKKISSHFKNLTILANPNFLNVEDTNRFFNSYYINRRKELNLFIENGKPYGGKWSFDSDNRKKIPKNISLPLSLVYENIFVDEAKEYCKKFKSVGECEIFYYPITFDEAKANLIYFLKNKFEKYGDYQDAIVASENFLFHSNISSALNIGLLDLHDVIHQIVKFDSPYNSKEGFIRQIIGWREFMLTVYKKSHVQLRTTNFFGFTNKISKKLFNGKSELTPFDDAVKKLHKTSYNHHIERLMILGNLFVLLEINPDDVYEFFMANYIDAYDWVMVGNVYGMSGYSDGGTITTKPYISSSNYIIKMSNDYKKSDSWCKIWDGLYWKFLDKYSYIFDENPRMKMQIALLHKMDATKLNTHKNIANEFIKSLQEENI